MPRNFGAAKRVCDVLELDYRGLSGDYGSSVDGAAGFGARLRQARLASALTLRQLAKAACVDPTTLARWERSADPPVEWVADKVRRVERALRLT